MTPALLLLSAAVSLPAWWPSRRIRWWVLPLLASGALLGAALVATGVGASGSSGYGLTPALAAGLLASVAGGGPLTVAVLRTVSRRTDLNEAGRHEDSSRADDVVAAAEVLRGGAWIGALERAAVTATLVAGWPEGLAVVLAVKGLGRYPELRHAGAAERFIIGTLSSVLWASACAGVVALHHGG